MLARSLDAVERFRNVMTRATASDRRSTRRRMFGSIFARPDRAAKTAAKRRWAAMVQASARSFSTYLAQIVQAWQLLRMGVAADRLLREGKDGRAAGDEQFDEAFLRGRVLLANHFLLSPTCLDKSLLFWEQPFYRAVPSELGREASATRSDASRSPEMARVVFYLSCSGASRSRRARYLRVGVPITAVTLVVGWLILALLPV